MEMGIKSWVKKVPVLNDVVERKPTVWINTKKKDANSSCTKKSVLTKRDISDADARLRRFAPLLMEYFEDTKKLNGIIESPLRKLENMEQAFKKKSGFQGNLLLKMDSHLPIAGSVKARGGIYEVLYHAEKLALEEGLITLEDNYVKLSNKMSREFFSKHTIQVGSTGNLGLSIGITAAALGFNVVVHMSSDAKGWKKDLLRSKGVTVIEYDGDYTNAVERGRKLSDIDPSSYFVDDENSTILFIGYAVSVLRLKEQLQELEIKIDKNNPAIFYLPCGVGGAPGGITFGLKEIFGDNVHVFFIEPTQAPSMLIGMATGLHDKISIQEFGINGITEADGLAVGKPSKFVGTLMETLLDGIFTIEDKDLFNYMRELYKTEEILIEPSACATFEGPIKLFEYAATKEYLIRNNLVDKLDNISHIAWATGGSLVPDDIMKDYLAKYI